MYYALPNVWSDFTEPEVEAPRVEQRQAFALMQALGSCVMAARRAYGDEFVEKAMRGQGPSQLDEPISVEVIGTDGVSFDFVCFELRSLDFSNNKGSSNRDYSLCNRAWIDGDLALFKPVLPTGRLPLKWTKYRDLDMNTFARLFAALTRNKTLLV
ncbi:39S ribosomal protein L37, mitochondrial [Cichlidogyrus casuarinus]|uniref:39S ribosomal protein L37, mitochondrial n=1 Tax=Cichlidogyrus casuarinus TaxID=1844966 RepID=A0ABD2PP43_9PLAT